MFTDALHALVDAGKPIPRALRTVRKVTLEWSDRGLADVRLLDDPTFAGVRHIANVTWETLAARAGGAPRALESIELWLLEGGKRADMPSAKYAAALEDGALPRLKRLSLRTFVNGNLAPEPATPLFATPMVRHAGRIDCEPALGPIAGWVGLAATIDADPLSLKLTQFLALQLRATDDGVALSLLVDKAGYSGDVDHPYVLANTFGWIEAFMGTCEPGLVSTIDVVDRRWGREPAKLERFAAAFAPLHPAVPVRYGDA